MKNEFLTDWISAITDDAPCDYCEFRWRCKQHETACNQFVSWVYNGGDGWKDIKQNLPTKHLFKTAMTGYWKRGEKGDIHNEA